MKIDKQLMDELTSKAKSSERLRMAMDMRTSPTDNSQRMLNALEPGTIMPIHRHQKTSELMIVLRGSVRELYYDNEGKLADDFVVAAGGDIQMINIHAGQWHSLECLESGTVLFEAKDGAYAPLTAEDILEK